MYFLALAMDFDGTIARNGVVDRPTRDALRRLKESGRRLILVTGRELPDLARTVDDLTLFDRIVAENGALVCDPATGRERVIGTPPPAAFVERLAALGVAPVSVGRAIVATWEPHQDKVLQAIHELGLELQIVFNKGAVMVLPTGVNKDTGLHAALDELGLSINNTVGVGDAENDHAFLRDCGCSAAVANALGSVKDEVDIRLAAGHGAGVVELIDRIIAEDALLAPPARHCVAFGTLADAGCADLAPQEGNVLIVGGSESGKTRLAIALTENMAEKGFEFAVIDPESDYAGLAHTVAIGTETTAPLLSEALQLLGEARVNVVICTQALTIGARQTFLANFLGEVAALRGRTGRPHWLVVDEAHQVLPSGGEASDRIEETGARATIFVTLSPHHLSHRVLRSVGTVLALGEGAPHYIAGIAERIGIDPPAGLPVPQDVQLIRWKPGSGEAPVLVDLQPSDRPHLRHRGKYALGDVGAWRSFYFRGPRKRLNRPANNLYSFMEIAAEVGDEVWQHHLRAGDYTAWFRHVIKDEDLARIAERLEDDETVSAEESRRAIAVAVVQRYAGPADEWRRPASA